MGAKTARKWSQDRQKINPKIDLKISTDSDRFFLGFWLIVDAKIKQSLIKNRDPKDYESKKAEGYDLL